MTTPTTPTGAETLRALTPQHRELRQAIPEVYKGFAALSGAAFADGAIDRKTKELIALAIGVARMWSEGQVKVAPTAPMKSSASSALPLPPGRDPADVPRRSLPHLRKDHLVWVRQPRRAGEGHGPRRPMVPRAR